MRRSIFGCLALFVLFVFQAKKVGADPTEAKVAYTEGKNVSKYKGAKSGSVVIKSEKVVKVQPQIPS